MLLHRAYTVKLMQTKDMRNEHDLIWFPAFDKDPQRSRSLLEGTDKMDRDDMHASLPRQLGKGAGLGPRSCGWSDPETLQRLGLEDIAADLAAQNLLPA